MNKDRLARLIARKLAREASPEELKELELFLKENPQEEYLLSILTEYWSGAASAAASDPDDAEKHFRHILDASADEGLVTELSHHGRYAITRKMTYYAAAVLLIIGITGVTIMLMNTSGPTVQAKREVATKSGAKSRLLLPDGSTVWLNAESRIRYLPNFTDSTREVELEGEAYFDVVKNAHKPFIVRTRSIDIRVLGTAFNVKCYASETTEATLVSGLIQVTRNDMPGSGTTVLHPHEKIIVGKINDEGESDAEKTNTTAYSGNDLIVHTVKKNASDTALTETAWVYNRLVFDGQDFKEIAHEMERWFNVKIIFHDASVEKYRFHAKFENENINEVLTALQLSAPFTVKINNDEINIYKK